MAEDAFELLGLPRRYDIDLMQLEAAFLRRSASTHPDRFLDPLARAEAAGAFARLNEARAILADDERRANELMRLLGGPAKEQDTSLPDGFLIEMMEVRQEMEQAMASGDTAERSRMEHWAQERRAAYRHDVASLFQLVERSTDPGGESNAGEASRASILSQIRLQLNAWRYIERMIEQLE